MAGKEKQTQVPLPSPKPWIRKSADVIAQAQQLLAEKDQ